METGTLEAAIYCRISADAEGRELGVDRQEADCRALAERLGMVVREVVVDNDLSASTNSSKTRPQYDDLLAQVRRGRFAAILAYSNSRLTRRPREFEDLLELHRQTGVRLVTVVSGEDNLATADGRMVARFKAVADAAEAERTSERVKRAKSQTAEAGRYRGGPRPYGFNKDGVSHRKREAEVIREATAAVLAGRSLRGIAQDLNERSITAPNGSRWDGSRLREILTRPRNAALINRGRADRGVLDIVGPAAWQPIVDEETWRAMYALLRDPARKINRGANLRRWFGSGLYRCGLCGGPMRASAIGGTAKRPRPREVFYRCQELSHLMIKQTPTDNYVKDVIVELLRDPRVVRAMASDDDGEDRLSADRERRAVLVARLEQTERDHDEDLIDARRFKAKSDRLQVEIAQIDERFAEAMTTGATSPIANAPDPGQAFLDAPLDVQRAVLAEVILVEVHPATRNGKWTKDRLRLRYVSDTDAAGTRCDHRRLPGVRGRTPAPQPGRAVPDARAAVGGDRIHRAQRLALRQDDAREPALVRGPPGPARRRPRGALRDDPAVPLPAALAATAVPRARPGRLHLLDHRGRHDHQPEARRRRGLEPEQDTLF